jgi:hypothetical protein
MVAASLTMFTALSVKMDAHTKNGGAEVDLIGEGMWNLICFGINYAKLIMILALD